MRNLTAVYQFAAAKRDDLRREDSQASLSFADALSQWSALTDADRRKWEEKALEAQKRYFGECMERAASAVDGDADADADGDDGDSEAEADEADGRAKRDERDDADGEMLKLELPQSRVTKVVRCNKDVGKISRDANFLIAKAAEFFLERRVSETALETARQHRKIILLRDFIAALSLNKNPQALQVFIDEFQPLRPENPAPSKAARKPASSKKRAETQLKEGLQASKTEDAVLSEEGAKKKSRKG